MIPRASAAILSCATLLISPAALMAAAQRPPRIGSDALAQRAYSVLSRSCFKCHGDGVKTSGLDLRTRELALKGGTHGPDIAPGKAPASRLIRMVTGQIKPQMPPTGGLPDSDVAVLKEWVAAGAPYPAAASAAGDGKWWAFRPISKAASPALKDPWIRNPIDDFVLAKLKEDGLRPSPEADRRTLIRRATFDLHGLPPTPEEVEAFVNNPAPDAYEKLIDRLLASPRYGERWGRHWLDLARFAESEGFKADETRPNAWHYRDYVIQSFNQDKPYDRFMKEQIAGDEIAPDDPQALIATGFCRHWPDESNAKNIPLRRQEILNDITDTVGSVFLGLTVGCARCHDHKYDPISHKDYYSLQAFFSGIQPRSDIPLLPKPKLEEYQRRLAEYEAKTGPARTELTSLEEPVRQKLMKGKRAAYTPDVQEAIDSPPAQRTALQWQLFNKVWPQIEVTDEEVGKAMKGEDHKKWEALTTELKKYDPLRPASPPTCLGITDVSTKAAPVHVLRVGVYDAPMDEVQPAFIQAIDTSKPNIRPLPELNSTGRRTALAEWLASPKNPITPRVMVNRVWQYHFSRGIVPTSSDFGKAGEMPTHPELLDWLSSEFMRDGWKLKPLQRLIMTSATYRQASTFNAANAAKDPDDRLLWRYRPWRLEGEAVRDACLAASGELNLKMGGPSIFPELPDGISTRGGWPETKDERERNRRSVYVFVRRNLRYPLFQAFDFPDTHEPCARRNVTNTAPQALMLFNGSLLLKRAQAMAGRIATEANSPDERVDRAYRLAFGRDPAADERSAALEFIGKQTQLIRRRVEKKEPVAAPVGASMDPAEGAAWVDFCHALMNSNEFLYVD